MNDVIVEFENIINIFPKQISEINNNRFTLKLENKWSKNEILGHLIDSAIINYLRIRYCSLFLLTLSINHFFLT